MVVGKKFEITPVSEFYNIAKDSGVFFWNFIIDNQTKTPVSLDPLINEDASTPRGHHLRDLVNNYNITMYESYTKDSIDFLMGFGFKSDDIWYNKKKRFKPLFLAFNGLKYIRGIPSNEVTCYCLNGVVETIILTDPTLLPLD